LKRITPPKKDLIHKIIKTNKIKDTAAVIQPFKNEPNILKKIANKTTNDNTNKM
jgi:hypothetical protein